MREFTNIRTGKKYIAKEYWLSKCPVCGWSLYWNSYKDLVVAHDKMDDIGLALKVEYCDHCEDYFIHIT